MAAPVDSNRVGTNISTAATSHTINVGSPASGNLLIVFVRFAGAPGTVTFTGYTQFAADTSDASDDDSRLYYRWADGTEGATDAMSTANSIKLAAICWVITGAENPATTAPTVGGVVIGTAANINPGAATPGSIDLTGAAVGVVNLQGATSTIEEYGHSFVAASSQVSEVAALLGKVASPTDNLLVEIQTDSSGSPSGTSIGAVATIAGTSLTTTQTLTTWSGLSIAVTKGTTYWVVFRRSSAVDTTNYYALSRTGQFPPTFTKVKNIGSWVAAAFENAVRILTPVAAADYLFLTVIGLDSETATFTSPSGYSTATTANSGTGGAVATNCMIAGASKAATAVTSDDPGAWTSSAPNAGVSAWTIAIPAPAAAAAPGPTPFFLKSPLRRRAARFMTFR